MIDPYVRVRVKNDQIDKTNLNMTMNPFDEIAVEEAIRMKEKNPAVEIILVSVGDGDCQETLRHGLALGADRAIHVATENELLPLAIAKILQVMSEKNNVDLVLMGKQAIDGDHNQTGQMLAALLDWPQGTFASQVDLDKAEVRVTREVDGGLETLALKLPAVLTTDLRLNEPRYAALTHIMKAKNKPLESIPLEALGVEATDKQKILKVELPPVRQGGKMVSSVDELVECLAQAQVLPL